MDFTVFMSYRILKGLTYIPQVPVANADPAAAARAGVARGRGVARALAAGYNTVHTGYKKWLKDHGPPFIRGAMYSLEALCGASQGASPGVPNAS